MRVIVSDTSCLVDLRKAAFLKAFACLPYEIQIPDVLFEKELLKFSHEQKNTLIHNGVKKVEVSSNAVAQSRELLNAYPALSVNDCFAYLVAHEFHNSILLTGDSSLRKLAIESRLEVHGVLWVIDEIYANGLASSKDIYDALQVFEADNSVLLPEKDLYTRINKYRSLTC